MDVNNFREKLKKEIHEYMDMQISSRNVTAITDMIACLGALDAFEGAKDAEHFDMSTAQKWVDGMKNDDGTHGAHWTIEQTTAVAESLDIPLDPKRDFERGAVSVGKQEAHKDLNENSSKKLLDEYKEKIGQIIIGYYQREHKGNIYVELGKVEGVLPVKYQSPREVYEKIYEIEARNKN